MKVDLVAIDPSGGLATPIASLPEMLRDNCKATADFYKVTGFTPPWIGYVSVSEGRAVGGGGFKGAPRNNKALPELEGRGFASATARELVRIGRSAIPGIVVTAQTLPTPNASNALLRNLGFEFQGSVIHPEDGEVWEWRLAQGR